MSYKFSKTGEQINDILSKMSYDSTNSRLSFSAPLKINNNATITELYVNSSVAPATNPCGIRFNNSGSSEIAHLYPLVTTTNSIGHASHFSFVQNSYNSSTGTILTNYECFTLPNTTADLAANQTWKIWTTKEMPLPLSIANGGTGATSYKGARDALGLQYVYFSANTQKSITVDSGYRGFLFLGSAYSSCVGIYRIQCNNSGVITNPIVLAEAPGVTSGVTLDIATANTLKVTTTQNTQAMFLNLANSVTI